MLFCDELRTLPQKCQWQNLSKGGQYEKDQNILVLIVALATALICLIDCNDTQTVAVESVALNKTELTFKVGENETLTATVTPYDATNKSVTWTSSNTQVVTVDAGKVTAVSAGTATITATASGKSATCAVTVNVAVDRTVTEAEWKQCLSDFLDNEFNFTGIMGKSGYQARYNYTDTVVFGESNECDSSYMVKREDGLEIYMYDDEKQQ